MKKKASSIKNNKEKTITDYFELDFNKIVEYYISGYKLKDNLELTGYDYFLDTPNNRLLIKLISKEK